MKRHRLEKLVLKGHVIFWLETNASTEYVCKGSTLLGKSIDDRSARRSEWGLGVVSH